MFGFNSDLILDLFSFLKQIWHRLTSLKYLSKSEEAARYSGLLWDSRFHIPWLNARGSMAQQSLETNLDEKQTRKR